MGADGDAGCPRSGESGKWAARRSLWHCRIRSMQVVSVLRSVLPHLALTQPFENDVDSASCEGLRMQSLG